ncbi:hypothetical protein FF1_004940 [Malus domestica]
MGSPAVFVQLSVLLLSCFAVFGDVITTLPAIPPHHSIHYSHPVASPTHPPAHPPTHGHHHHHPHPHPHPPTHSPVHPPAHSPVHPPAHSPVHPPAHSPVHPPAHSPIHPPNPHHHHHGHPPAHAPTHVPVQPPSHPPTHHAPPPHPPAHSPVHPPVHPPMYPPKKPFPRSFVAVQGVVYCKSCNYSGVDTLNGAKPVLGATVKLQCNNTKYPLVVKKTTDKNGYFFITAPKTVTTFGAHKCKVSLVSAPSTACSKPSDLHGGLSGALLRPVKPFVSQKLPFLLYNVGPFAFEPKCPR